VSDDGLTYNFKLHEGLKFSSGRDLTAEDYRWSFERHMKIGWGTAYYMMIKGAKAFGGGDTEHLEGLQVLDDHTVQFTLDTPASYFLQLLAIPWTFVVDKEAVEEHGDDYAFNPAGSGPFVLEEWTPGQKAIFTKNPNYFRDDEPYLDQVIWEVGVDPEVALLRLEKGEIDLMEDRIPVSQLQRITSDPKWQPYVLAAPGNDTYYMTLRPANEEYSDIRVRQAIYMAIDREKMVKITGGRGQPAYGLLAPPSGDWHNPDIARYDYDPEGARALLAEAGYPDGFKTEAWSYNVSPYPEIAQAVQQDLAAIGIDVDLHLVSRPAWAASNRNPEVGLGFNSWSLEVPDPSYIYDSAFTCASFFPDSCCNFSYYCTEELDAQVMAASMETDYATRVGLYHELDQTVCHDLILWVPLYHPGWVFIHSPKVGGYTYPVVLAWTMQVPRYWSATGQ